MPSEEDHAFIRVIEAGDEFQYGALAGAVRADNDLWSFQIRRFGSAKTTEGRTQSCPGPTLNEISRSVYLSVPGYLNETFL